MMTSQDRASTVTVPSVEELERMVLGDGDADTLAAVMCSCSSGDDNPH